VDTRLDGTSMQRLTAAKETEVWVPSPGYVLITSPIGETTVATAGNEWLRDNNPIIVDHVAKKLQRG
jgi:hypothetical protein